MTKAPTISRRVWLAFGGSVLLFGLVGWIAHRTQPPSSAHAAEFTALTGEKERLRGNDDSVRNRLREAQRGLARIAWTTEKLAALQQREGSAWRWTWAPGDLPGRVTLERVAPRLEEWPAYRAFVAELSAQPGVVIESVEILAAGAARDRRLTRVTIGLRFIVAVAPSHDGQRAFPSPGPPTVAPAKGPATPRKVGAFTSHRRPSASAEPPAIGTTGAPFQCRPSGFWAGAVRSGSILGQISTRSSSIRETARNCCSQYAPHSGVTRYLLRRWGVDLCK